MDASLNEPSSTRHAAAAPRPHAAVDELGRTREELRALIAPRSSSRRSGDQFPRSTLMRAALNPELRWVWLGGLSLLAILASRRVPVGRLNPWLLALTAARGALRGHRD